MTALLWLSVALAGTPTTSTNGSNLLPWAAPWEVQDAYNTHRDAKGEPRELLACGGLWKEAVKLCLQREQDGRLVRLHADDLDGSWSAERDRLRESASDWVRGEVERVQVEGMRASYLRLRDRRGRAILGALAPDVLASETGLPLVVGIPQTGVLVAWKGGDTDLDRIMAIGVRELHDGARDAVSPVVWAWDGERWFPYVEAKPAEPEAPAPLPDPEASKDEGPPTNR